MEKKMNKDLKNMLIGFGVILLYLILSSLPYDFLLMFGINYNNLTLITKQLYLISYEVILTLIIIYIYMSNFIPNIKNFFKNIKSYFNNYFRYWFLMFGLMILSNLIVTMFTTTEVAQNQQNIIETLKQAPFYTLIVTIVIAPILEELVFRLSFKKIFANTNILFIFFSGLLFGSMHVLGSLNNLVDLLFIIPYSIPGFVFAYTLSKSDNICVPIGLHMFHNSIMMALQILLLLV